MLAPLLTLKPSATRDAVIHPAASSAVTSALHPSLQRPCRPGEVPRFAPFRRSAGRRSARVAAPPRQRRRMAASACVERTDLEAGAAEPYTESEIVFRELQPRDVIELRELQLALFPARQQAQSISLATHATNHCSGGPPSLLSAAFWALEEQPRRSAA